jgi:hypothetical protein
MTVPAHMVFRHPQGRWAAERFFPKTSPTGLA